MKWGVILSAAAALVLGGCSTVSQDEVFDSLNRLSQNRGTGELKWIKTTEEAKAIDERIKILLEKPLSEENAVQIALINNRGLQQAYERIGIAQSDLIQAGLMSNPVFGYSLGHGGGVTTSTMSVELAFLDLLWIPLRKELGGLALEEAKLSVGDTVLQTLRETKKSYIDVRIAEETLRLHEEMVRSYEASLQLSIRQYAAGNLSKRGYLKIQDEYAHARIESIRARREYAMAREGLNQMMGLYGEQTHYSLSAEPMALSAPQLSAEEVERRAIENRLDIAAARKAVEYAATEAGYTENSRLLQEVTLDAQYEKSTGADRIKTYGIKIPIPIFDLGQGRVSQSQSRYNQSVHHLYELAVNVRSQSREEYAKMHYAYDIAREYQESILQTNRQILQETQLFYNGMLDGIYELLSDQRRYTDAKIQSLSAIGEYRKATADLVYIIGGETKMSKDQL